MRYYRVTGINQNEEMQVYNLDFEDFQRSYPEFYQGKLSFAFLKDFVIVLRMDLALMLTEKYDDLHIVDDFGNIIDYEDDLDHQHENSALRLAYLYQQAADFDVVVDGLSELEIKFAIREKKNEKKMLQKILQEVS